MPRHERFIRQSGAEPPQESSESRHADIIMRLEQAVGEIHDSETFRRYLDMQSRFHHYSFGNTLLILMQRPEATQVAGFHAWRKLNRFVKNGEKGIRIVVPGTGRCDALCASSRSLAPTRRAYFWPVALASLPTA